MSASQLLHRYEDILALIDQVDAVAYARTRNHTDGAVSYLSPYISRGVISLPLVREKILRRYTSQQAYTFIFELAWREYFQRQWAQLGDQIWTDIRQPQAGMQHRMVPDALVSHHTGIEAIDDAIRRLYSSAYMHNHVRMYVASLACHIARAHWREPSRWMYYHLADHDIASNTLSWQWVAGTFSSKKYYCDQSNINKYCATHQHGTYLDVPYERLADMSVPDILRPHALPELRTTLPDTARPTLDHHRPLLLYNAYNLDPLWRKDMDANRVLLIEPSHYDRYPVSDLVLSFILSLSRNIDGLQIFVGEVDELLSGEKFPAIYSRRHTAFLHYPGIRDEPEWMFPTVSTVNHSFMAYWKQCEKYL
jgi:deoxyribodipyrimidine photo-lyase